MEQTRKGIGYGDKLASDVNKINALGVDWWYNWGPRRIAATKDSVKAEFVPMLYSDSQTRLDSWAADIAALKAEVPKTITAVLGPNEPDWLDDDGVPKMTPFETLTMWRYLMESGYGLRKGSPANVSTRTIWMDQFLDAQAALDQTKQSWERDFEVNFVATHIYQQPHAGTWLDKVDELYDKFGKPVWVTETCVHDFSAKPEIRDANGVVLQAAVANRYTRAEVNEFIKEIWAASKTRPWLERIAWHTRDITDPVGVSGALFNTNGTLTGTGLTWRDLS